MNCESESPLSVFWTHIDDDDGGDGVPRVCCNVNAEALFGPAIGHGGYRGSLVYGTEGLAEFLFFFGYPLALKMYPVRLMENELAFIRALFYNDLVAFNTSGEKKGLCRRVPYLALPVAIVTVGGVDRGILMSQYNCSLKQFLFATRNVLTVMDTDVGKEFSEKTSFISCRAFDPIRAYEVVAAIVFQLVFAVAVLNGELPHEVDGVTCRGFAHNDIHLDNILLSRSSGRVALCDFELVTHITKEGEVLPPRDLHRLPPYCRQSPHGPFCNTADSWAIGLLVLSLITGVDPLFADEKLMDDFGEGPLLQSYTMSEKTVPVLDWEANIKEHVEWLLLRDDPTGRCLSDAQQLLDLCAKCLVNRPGVNPSLPSELLSEPVFSIFMESPLKTDNILENWIRTEGSKL